MARIRQLPDGRYVVKDDDGRMYFRKADGELIAELKRGDPTYLSLGLQAEFDDRALFNHMDPSTTNDPYVLVWIGNKGVYGTRAESNLDKYGSVNPTAEQIEKGGYLPPVGEGAGYAEPTETWPFTAAAQPAADPAPAAIPGPGAGPEPELSLWGKIVAFFKRLFS